MLGNDTIETADAFKGLGNGTEPGVIWISGYSASGKTTVGRMVQRTLSQSGIPVVFLDGDDLRSIFAGKWGYGRNDRIELAKIYFRLCSHLAAQGKTVVISAVAMYDEVRDWLKENVPGSVEVYLDVPEGERKRRDQLTKNLYSEMGSTEVMYDLPKKPDLVIKNYQKIDAVEAAKQIISYCANRRVSRADRGRQKHWSQYYSSSSVATEPSPFAEFVNQQIPGCQRVLEIGCGNGRDASYFSRQGHDVTALDVSSAAIKRAEDTYANLTTKFLSGSILDVRERLPVDFDIAYSRFVLHAMPVDEEMETLAVANGVLKRGGTLFVECRSINDPLASRGEVISPTERIHGHYRRFIIREELESRLEDTGFQILECIEGKGLARYGDEDPVVIRAVAEKMDGA